MMNEMMKQCCGEDGKPNFEKMKQFMEHCRNVDFNDDEITMMKQCCEQEGEPNFQQMKQFVEKCGCHLP